LARAHNGQFARMLVCYQWLAVAFCGRPGAGISAPGLYGSERLASINKLRPGRRDARGV
jgi:hypothetical protein